MRRKYSFQLLLVLWCFFDMARGFVAESECTENKKLAFYLQVAENMIEKAREHSPNLEALTTQKTNTEYLPCAEEPPAAPRPTDCWDVLQLGHNNSGLYEVWPKSGIMGGRPLSVFCDMDTDEGGWTVIQRRGNYEDPADYFYRDWMSYKYGFGNLKKQFWLGNDNIFALTSQQLYSVRFDLRDTEYNRRHAHYDNFWIEGESTKYTLHISGYSGDAGDAMEHHNHRKFSTKEQDNDVDVKRHCAQVFKGAWWYGDCYKANLNGMDRREESGAKEGIVWKQWKGDLSLDKTEVKIRPKNTKAKLIV